MKGGELRQIIIESCCALNDRLKSAFNAFDKKQNGKVKLSAIGEVLKEAGQTITEEEASIARFSLDLNGDGRIYYEDFRRWWFNGHRGRSGMVGQVIKVKSQLIQWAKSIQPNLKQILGELQASGGPIEYAESSCSVGFNKIKPEEVKCQVDLHASLFSKESEAEFEDLLKMHPKLRPH